MFTDHISQFFDGVVPAYKHYVDLSRKKDNKKFMLMNAALQAAHMLFHYREALFPVFNEKKLQVYKIASMCPDYHIVGRVFDKSKHVTLRNPAPLVNNPSAIEETFVMTYFPRFENGEYTKSLYGIMQTRVMINFQNRETRDLLDICTNVVNFWADFLVKNNLTTKRIQFKYEGDDFLTEDQAKIITSFDTIHPKEIGGAQIVLIARLYRPLLNKFLRLQFKADGTIVAIPVEGVNHNNIKLYGHFPDMKPIELS